jgi:hypothetical protein
MPSDRPKHARVYVRRDGKKVLIVTLHYTQEGLLVEADGPLALTSWDDDALGEAVQTAWDQSSTIVKDLRGRKMSDGAVLKMSGEPSARSFHSGYVQIDVSGANGSNLTVFIEGIPGDGDLTLRTSMVSHAPPTEFGRQILRIFQICRDRKF